MFIHSSSVLEKNERFLIPILGVFDMVACVAGSSFALMINFHYYIFRWDIICRLFWTFNKFTSLSSAFMLLVIAVQRYCAVCKPFGWQLNNSRGKYVVVGNIALSLVLALPCLYLIGVNKKIVEYKSINITVYECGIDGNNDRYDKIYSMTLFLVCFTGIMALSILYILIVRTVYKQEAFKERRRIGKRKQAIPLARINIISKSETISGTSESEIGNEKDKSALKSTDGSRCFEVSCRNGPKQDKASGSLKNFKNVLERVSRKNKISLMFLFITVLFVVSYFPRITLMILESTNEKFWDQLTESHFVILTIIYKVYLINNIVNPIIYFIFDTPFRKACRALFKRR